MSNRSWFPRAVEGTRGVQSHVLARETIRLPLRAETFSTIQVVTTAATARSKAKFDSRAVVRFSGRWAEDLRERAVEQRAWIERRGIPGTIPSRLVSI